MIYVIDELTVRPGLLRDTTELVEREYAPGAAERCMVLEHVWTAPPVELLDQPNQLVFVWSIAGVAEWWQMRASAAADPSVPEFWRKLDELVESRSRRFVSSVEAGA